MSREIERAELHKTIRLIANDYNLSPSSYVEQESVVRNLRTTAKARKWQ